MSEYCDGIKFATKLVEPDARIMNIKAITVICKLSNLPIISVGFVNILSIASGPCFKKISDPTTIKSAKKEKIIKLKIKPKFPFFN